MQMISLLITMIGFLSMTKIIDLQAGGKRRGFGHALRFHH